MSSLLEKNQGKAKEARMSLKITEVEKKQIVRMSHRDERLVRAEYCTVSDTPHMCANKSSDQLGHAL